MSWDLTALAQAAGGRLEGGVSGVRIEAVSTDSRTLPGGALFVALRGEHFDGHAFVAAAVQAGARAVVVDQQAVTAGLPNLGVPRVVVSDTLWALGNMARGVRCEHNKPVAAVTGSNGKTTTKELLAAVLAERGPVHKTHGNLNNLIGVPLTLFRWDPGAWAAVVEMGMNAPGEIARMAEIAGPQVGVVTCVAAAHLGGKGLGSIAAIAHAKAEMYAGLAADAVAVVNADDAPLMEAARQVVGQRRVVRFGRGAHCDVRIAGCVARGDGIDVRLVVAGAAMAFSLPLLGVHNAYNAAAACAAAQVLGMTPAQMAAGLPHVKVPGGRLRQVHVAARQITVLDDSYNANPGSMAAAFAAQRDIARGARCIAALGDMLELGDTAAALHRQVGEAAGKHGIQLVFALGSHADETAAGARQAGATAHAYPAVDPDNPDGNLPALCHDLLLALRPGDVVLVKGSRGLRMERVVQALEES